MSGEGDLLFGHALSEKHEDKGQVAVYSKCPGEKSVGNGIGVVGHECGQSCWVVEDYGGIWVFQIARNGQRASRFGVYVGPELAVAERDAGDHQVDSGGVNGIGGI